MLADLMYQRNENEEAIKHFSVLLERDPSKFLFNKPKLFLDHYHALSHYIELAWRKGDLDQAEKYMKVALDSNSRANIDAGYNYCRGQIEW